MTETKSLRGFVVLVVDDDPDGRDMAAAMLESLGTSVLTPTRSERRSLIAVGRRSITW